MAKAEQAPTLREMGVVLEGSGWPEGDAIVRDFMDRCHASEASTVILELIAKVTTMKMGSHFRTDKPPNEIYLPKASAVSPDLSEAEYKRQCLLFALRKVHNNLATVFGALSNVILDIEASSREFTGVQSQHAGTTPEDSVGTGDSITAES